MLAHIMAKEKIALPITAITLQREPGYEEHPSPFYALTLRRDGRAIYVGVAYAKLSGTYQAVVPVSRFERIADLVKTSDFVHFKAFYGDAGNDIPAVGVSVAGTGTRKSVMDEGEPPRSNDASAPKALQQIELLMDAAVVNAKWKKISNKTDLPNYSPNLTLPKK